MVPYPTWDRLRPERRAAVLNAAREEFVTRGYSSGSMNAIAREAGVAKGSLFQYFTDKLDLYSYVCEQTVEKVRSHMLHVIAELDFEQDFWGSLRVAWMDWIDFYGQYDDVRALSTNVQQEADQQVRTVIRQMFNRHWVDVLLPLLQEARERGDLRPDADLEAMITTLALLLPHLALVPYSPGLEPSLGMVAGRSQTIVAGVERMADMLERAFSARPLGTVIGDESHVLEVARGGARAS